MSVIVGIDEAGYAPKLGPMAVSAAVFEAPFDSPPTCFWEILGGAVSRDVASANGALPVADSKVLYGGRGRLGTLETGVLSFLRVAGLRPTSVSALLGALGGTFPGSLKDAPWYGGLADSLPADADLHRVDEHAAKLADALDAAGVRFLGIRSRVMSARQLNAASVGANKAGVLFGLVIDLVREVRRLYGAARTLVVCDKLGGRHYYERPLGAHFPMTAMEIVAQGPEMSRYRMRADGGVLDLSFVAKADGAHLPVALASMTSKYVRELMMRAFNRFWRARVPGLEPTSGYPQDARRFIESIGPEVRQLSIRREHLVRAR